MIYLTKQFYKEYYLRNRKFIEGEVARIKLLTGYSIDRDLSTYVLFSMSNNLKDTVYVSLENYPTLPLDGFSRLYHSRKLLGMRYRVIVKLKSGQEISYESI